MSNLLSNQPLTDTPVKKSNTLATTYGMSALAIKKRVEEELRGNIRIVSKQHFVGKILGIEADISSSLLNALEKQKLYSNKKKKWSGLPGRKEKDFYEPLVAIANAVGSLCVAPHDSVNATWYSTPHTAPESRNLDRAAIQPDIVYVSRKEIAEHLEANLEVENGGSKLTDKGHRFLKLWWLQVHACLEVKVKPSTSKDLNNHIIQLCSYMRQMFREQLDRRFVLGLLLCGSHLTMWLCDRSGVVGTLDPIDIDNEPKEFIKVLSAFSMLPAHRLGWDPTMKIYQEGGKGPIPSYEINPDPRMECFEENLYRQNWVISMPIPGTDEREDFVTIRAIVASSSERVCSRATVVWEVIKLIDVVNNKEKPEVYVLKQSWQPIRREDICKGKITLNEADMYERANLGERIFSSEVPQSPNGGANKAGEGPADTTFSIRHGDIGALYSEAIGNQKIAPQKRERDKQEEPFALYNHLICEGDSLFDINNEVFLRALQRVVQKGTGYPVTSFADLTELIRVFIDCIKDHKKMCDSKVLHRDVSTGNMLIMMREVMEDEEIQNEDTIATGRLIDFDHAKWVDANFKPHNHGPVPAEKRRFLDDCLALDSLKVDQEVQDRVWMYYGGMKKVTTYLGELHDGMPDCLKCSNWTMGELYWPPEFTTTVPDFSVHNPREGFERTGTIPFMATETLIGTGIGLIPRPNKPGNDKRYTYFHDAAHDIESFLWVLIYICTKYQDPAFTLDKSPARGELPQCHTNVVKALFSQEDPGHIRLARNEYFASITHFVESIPPTFNGYFEPLKMLVVRWFWIMRNAFKFRAIEYHHIHDIVLNLLQAELKKLRENRTDEQREVAKAIKSKRYEEWKERRKCPKGSNQVNDPESQDNQGCDKAAASQSESTATTLRRSKRAKLMNRNAQGR